MSRYIRDGILLLALMGAAWAEGGPPPGLSRSPTEEEIAGTRAAFLALSRPLDYKYVVVKPARNPLVTSLDALSRIELRGDARELVEKTPALNLIYALWPFLTNHTYDAEAFIILVGALEPEFSGDWDTRFISVDKPGDWPLSRTYAVDFCKRLCRSVLNQPEWWYPHPILFDRATVLSESETNATVRAAHIAAMVKALADPKIRTENPLEVNNILLILDALDAREAAQTFVEYAFFDRSTGRDFRRRSDSTNDFSDVHGLILPILTLIPRLGTEALPLVLERFANATEEENSIERGGGAFPVLAVVYFVALGYTEDQAAEAIIEHERQHRNLTSSQVQSLHEIHSVIVGKQYRPWWLSSSGRPSARTWAATDPTNALPNRRP